MQITYSTSTEAAVAALAELSQDTYIGLDIETGGLDPHTSGLCLIQLNISNMVYVLQPNSVLINALRYYPGLVIGHNLKHEAKYLLHHYGIKLGRVFDTFRASQLLYNGLDKYRHGLWDVWEQELAIDESKRSALGIYDHQVSNWGAANLTPGQLLYAASDVFFLPDLYHALVPKLHKAGLMQVATLEMRVVLAEAQLELAGMPINQQMWLDRARVDAKLGRYLEDALLKELPSPNGQLGLFGGGQWNLNSTQQLILSLNQLGANLWVEEPNNQGEMVRKQSTAEEVLVRNASRIPLIAKLLKQRMYIKGNSTYGKDYLEFINPVTGRIHANLWPFTGAGRYSCGKPNLQQLDRCSAVRGCFAPESGQVLVIADFSTVEIRIAAEISKDPVLIQAFRNGEDVHSSTAKLVTGKLTVTKGDRQLAKAVNFSMIYGGGAETLQSYAKTNYGVELSLEEATQVRTNFFTAYKGLKAWHKIATAPWKDAEPARSVAGRLRYLPKGAYTDRLNTPCQSTGADILKVAMRNVVDCMPDVKMCMCCHDEIIMECAESEGPVVTKLLQESMEKAGSQIVKSVPIVAEASVCKSWADK